ncbi:glycosyl hydrolase [Asticcacaulis sp. YBE204]|uniref:glycosyl hydrolase n=1 Tax=Asticcacaulis sp. YBE204 TaxID=1282363 RepID=UPI00041DE6D2|nr:glycosyl hydrolase [Asticcacaulis sp. YBE204]
MPRPATQSLRLLLTTSLAVAALWGPAQADTVADGFAAPPAEARPMVRWWWFGPKVSDAEIVREIKAMKQGGFGGFELAALYPLELDGNQPYLSDQHLAALKRANETGRAEGLRVDVTLGSGWPFGGPHITADLAAARVALVKLPLAASATAVDLPTLKPGERVVAAFVGTSAADAVLVEPTAGKVTVKAAPAARTVFVVLQSPTGQQVKRASVGSEGYVLDHMSPDAVQTHLHAVGDRLLTAFPDAKPYAVFSDSLEAYGTDWTDDLLAEFKKRRGYDLKPHLLKWFDTTPDSAAIRRDWGLTLAELTEERYLTPVNDWAKRNGTRFRSQTYGHPPVTLSSMRRVDLADGEGADWRIFSRMRWASSANHLYEKSVTSAEAWTWLHQGAFQATPLDIKAEADTLMLQGVNHFIAHGWPYSPPEAPEPGWAMYAAAVFNDHNPWWTVMPEVNLYLQRMSWLLQQGQPVADIAVYIPQDDALAASKPGTVSVDGEAGKYITKGPTAQILDAGFAFDYVDDEALSAKGFKAKVLILPKMTRIDPAAYAKIEAFAKAGGWVVAVDRLPDSGADLIEAEADTAAVKAISARLFKGTIVAENDVGATLKTIAAPDVTGLTPETGFVHRKLADGDLYFVANTGNTPVTLPLTFSAGNTGQVWNAVDGTVRAWDGAPVTLAPYESRVFVFGAAASAKLTPVVTAKAPSRPLVSGWTLSFGTSTKPVAAFGSWTNDPARQHFSGVATYSRTIKLNKADLAAGLTRLDFGDGTPETIPNGRRNGSRAWLNAPVRDAAEVFVNGQRAGAVWTAPYEIDLKPFLKAGDNRIEIRVANTAVNTLAGRPATDYTALRAKYGDRFQPQNMDNLKPLPSGLMQAPVLETAQ